MRPVILVMSEGCSSFARRKLRDARGAHRAAAALLEHTLDMAELVGEVVLCAPLQEETAALSQRRGIRLLPQAKGRLGARIAAAVAALAPLHPGQPLLLLGDDCPGLEEAHLLRAAGALSHGAGSVWGRARDGGFWLLGLSRWDAPLFASLATAVEWGSPRAGLTLARFLLEIPGRMVELPELSDVDGPEDLTGAIREAVPSLARALGEVRPGTAPAEEEIPPAFAGTLVTSRLPRPPPL